VAWLVALVVAGLSAGVSYAAAPAGSVLAFGFNQYGQLGVGD